MAEAASARIRARLTTCEITRRENLTHDLFKIWIKPAQPFMFKPGQYCTIGVEGIERAYSIVSSPDEEEIELFIEVVPPPDGNLTPLLDELGVGAEMTLRPRAKGIFVLQPQYKHHILVGTVTGTVPYISILRKFLNDPEYPAPARNEDPVARDPTSAGATARSGCGALGSREPGQAQRTVARRLQGSAASAS